LLAAPERRDRVGTRQLRRRVLGDVREGEVVTEERAEQDQRRDKGRRERAEQGVRGRLREPAASRGGGPGAGDRRPQHERERDEQRGATEVGHASAGLLRGLVLRRTLRDE